MQFSINCICVQLIHQLTNLGKYLLALGSIANGPVLVRLVTQHG